MKEIEDIVLAFDRARQQGKQAALATVVHVEGSSYRRPGARMLVTEDGQLTGAISGGCLEGDALRKAQLAMTEQKTKLVTYDTTDEDDARLGVQLGCNGIVHILIEPLNPALPDHPVELLRTLVTRRQKGVLVTLFSLKRSHSQPGTCLLYSGDGNCSGTMPPALFSSLLVKDAGEALLQQQSLLRSYPGAEGILTAFVEFIPPPVSLVIAGAGNDALPLVAMAAVLGWQCTVVDGRPAYASPLRFPNVHRLLVGAPAEVLPKVPVDERTVFVLMTHNYNYDLALLRLLLQRDVVYIGSLGPKKKLERMLDELRVEGAALLPDQLSRVYGPVGLDIGAETPEEIALSIIAEIKAVLSGASGSPLRQKKEAIHQRELLI